MKSHPRTALALALLITASGIGGFLCIQRLWCDVAAYEDVQMRPIGDSRPYVPGPGPVLLEPDSYYWLGYAQRIARGEDWRVRHTALDNFPAGREVHWSQSVSWALVVFGKARALFTHESTVTAIEHASAAFNPLLFALAAGALFVTLTARFGALPSALCVAFVSTVGSIGWTFNALRPGHRGLHVVFGAASVLGLLFGGVGLTSQRSPTGTRWPLFRMPTAVDLPTARRWFTLAGVATGLALWVSATVESFFIYPMMAAFVLLLALLPPRSVAAEDLVVQPDLWRRWGLIAGTLGFAFYLLEYFPHHLAMRLEVNHPVYDLAVVGSGEALRLLSRMRWGGRPVSRAQWWQAAGWLALSALPVLLVVCGPVAWHHMRDVQMLRLHKFIGELYSYDNFVRSSRLIRFFELYGVAPLVCLLAPVFLLRRDLTVSQVTWLWFSFAFAFCFCVLSYLQLRWMAFFAASACLCAMVTAHFAFSLLPSGRSVRRTLVAAVAVLALLVQPVMFSHQQLANLAADLRGDRLGKRPDHPVAQQTLGLCLEGQPRLSEGGDCRSGHRAQSGVPRRDSLPDLVLLGKY